MTAKKEPRSKAWVISTVIVTSAISMPLLMSIAWYGILYSSYGSSQQQMANGVHNLGWLLILMIMAGVAGGSVYSVGYVKNKALIDRPTECTIPAIIIFTLVSLTGVLLMDSVINEIVSASSYEIASDSGANLARGILSTIIQTGIFGSIVWSGFLNWEKELGEK